MKYWDIKPPVKKFDKLKEFKRIMEELERNNRENIPYKVPIYNGQNIPCMHKNCPGCRTGTCSGIHMISCPCRSCSPWMMVENSPHNQVYKNVNNSLMLCVG